MNRYIFKALINNNQDARPRIMSTIPFDNWESFYAAFEEANSSEFYAESYPEYAAYLESDDGSDELIIKKLLLTEKAQDGLDRLVRAVLNGSRYVCESYSAVKHYIEMFLEAGAKITDDTISPLWMRTFDNSDDEDDDDDIEDEIQNYGARAMLIVQMEELVPTWRIAKFISGWSSIEPQYWEKTTHRSDLKYDEKRMMHLRYAVEAKMATEQVGDV